MFKNYICDLGGGLLFRNIKLLFKVYQNRLSASGDFLSCDFYFFYMAFSEWTKCEQITNSKCTRQESPKYLSIVMVLRAHGAPLKVSYNMLVINLSEIMLSLKLTLTLLVKITASVRCHSTSPYKWYKFY